MKNRAKPANQSQVEPVWNVEAKVDRMDLLRHEEAGPVELIEYHVANLKSLWRGGVVRDLAESEAGYNHAVDQLRGAVSLSDAEWERVLWWLHKPLPPGPAKALDEAIIRKITTQRGQ